MDTSNGTNQRYIDREEAFKKSPWYNYAIKLFETGYSYRSIEKKLKIGGCSTPMTDNTLKRILCENTEALNTRIIAITVQNAELEEQRQKMKVKLAKKLEKYLDNEQASPQEVKLAADYVKDYDQSRVEVVEEVVEAVTEDRDIHIIVENTTDEGGFEEEVKGLMEEANENKG